jgi:two-component system chemotaxis sensor kinase CheA
MSKDPYRYFRIEARELLDEMSRAVLDLEKGVAVQAEMPRLLRMAHTLKGAARVVRQHGLADHAHAIEETLTPWRDAAQALPRDVLSDLLARFDQMEDLLAALTHADGSAQAQAQAQAPARAASVQPLQVRPGKVADEAWRVIRTDIDELDAVLAGITESHVQAAMLKRHLQVAAKARDLADLLLNQLTIRRGREGAGLGGALQLASVREMAEDLCAVLGKLDADLSQTSDLLDRELRQTRDTAEQLRLAPARQLFNALERTVRDVAQAQGKQAVFAGHGGDVRLDAEVLANIQPALIQMARNAVAHGIEPPALRLRQGKAEAGQVSIRIVRQGRHVVFSCQDDGAGIDARAVMQVAQGQGRLDADAPANAETLLRLLLGGGVSTAGEVSEVSGRGIGLNVVEEARQRLDGEVFLQTEAGQGTTLSIKVPLSIASMPVLDVEAAGALASVPLEAVKQTTRLSAKDVTVGSHGDTIVHEGLSIPFLPLSTALRRPTGDVVPGMWSVAIVDATEGPVALGVDRLMGISNVVMRPLPELAPASDLVAGASVDVEGRPQIVLDPQGLLRRALAGSSQTGSAAPARLPILVIDDSLTTRMLEQSILESAGYLVHAAASAEEGLSMARQQRYALFLVDVDMPGMDGFTLMETMQADPMLRQTPGILVTSRDSPQDRQRGRQAGAKDYIVKGEFAQAAFLDSVRKLIQTA